MMAVTSLSVKQTLTHELVSASSLCTSKDDSLLHLLGISVRHLRCKNKFALASC